MNGAAPASRRRRSPSTMYANAVRGSCGVGEVVHDRGVLGVEVAGGGVLQVAALGDGEADDPHGGVVEPLVHGRGVVGAVEVLEHRADDAGLERAVRVAHHEGEQAVLRAHDVAHRGVLLEHADAADAPVQPRAGLHQPVEVHRDVRAVEVAEPEVDDPDGCRLPVVRRRGGRQGGQGRGRESSHRGRSFRSRRSRTLTGHRTNNAHRANGRSVGGGKRIGAEPGLHRTAVAPATFGVGATVGVPSAAGSTGRRISGGRTRPPGGPPRPGRPRRCWPATEVDAGPLGGGARPCRREVGGEHDLGGDLPVGGRVGALLPGQPVRGGPGRASSARASR